MLSILIYIKLNERNGYLVLISCLYFSPLKASKWLKVKDCCSPLVPRGKAGHLLTFCLVVIIVWTTSYVMLGRVAIPTDEKVDVSLQAGTVFALILLIVGSTIGGWLVSLVE